MRRSIGAAPSGPGVPPPARARRRGAAIARALQLRRLGLRGRVVLSFAAGTLLLSTGLAVATWSLSAGYLQGQQTRVGTSEALSRVVVVQQGLREGADVPRLLERVSSRTAEGLVNREGEWFSSALALTPQDLPRELVDAARSGRSVRQRIDVDGRPQLAVAVALPEQDAVYVALLPLQELDATLRALSVVLLVGTVVTSAAGAALGVWASRRALRPLTRVNAAAEAVAGGDLGARLETQDPDLRRLAATFNSTLSSLQGRVQRDSRFAANVSHELRSPVTTLANAVAVLAARRHEMSPTAADVVEVIEQEVTRFRTIVADLLEISLDDGGRELRLEAVRLDELVRAALGSRADLVQVDPRDVGELVVDGDRRRLLRVVCNLVDNADAHGGGVTGVHLRRQGDGLELVVHDAGPGVPPALRDDVFERFNRGTSARDASGGVGLGLALVAQHVRLHKGRVAIEEQPGGGARFVVWLPAAEPDGQQS